MAMTAQQRAAVLAVADAIVDAVKATGSHGAPGGILYSALMVHGYTLHNFHAIMDGLVSAGRLRKEGQLYFVVEPAKQSKQ